MVVILLTTLKLFIHECINSCIHIGWYNNTETDEQRHHDNIVLSEIIYSFISYTWCILILVGGEEGARGQQARNVWDSAIDIA